MKHFLETDGGQRSITLFIQTQLPPCSGSVLVLTRPVRTVLVLVPVPVRSVSSAGSELQQLQLMDSSSCLGPKYQQGNRPKQGSDPWVRRGGASRFPRWVAPRRDGRVSFSPSGGTGPVMELFDAGVKGRGLRASRELSAGEVLLAEPGYAAVVYSR